MKKFYIYLIIFSLMSILFITLFERKLLGLMNNRKAPNYYFLNSLGQSLMDFLKLLFKKNMKLNFVMKVLWNMMIFYGIIMLFFLMLNFPLLNSTLYYYLNFFFFFFLYSMMSFFFLLLSFSSNSIYAIMAMYRVLIQILSYEVGMIFLFFMPLIILNLFNYYFYYENYFLLLFFSLFYFYILLVISLSEMNRTPFDFLESETELVSGFNVEYLASLFSMIFLIEYGFFIFYSILLIFILMINILNIIIMIFILILMRSFLPRYRYDKMMYLFWKDMLFIIFSMYMYLFLF